VAKLPKLVRKTYERRRSFKLHDLCGPNRAMGQLHDRMPVILAEIDWPKWLGEEPASEQDLLAFSQTMPGRHKNELLFEQQRRAPAIDLQSLSAP
jgi:hypothetical protein